MYPIDFSEIFSSHWIISVELSFTHEAWPKLPRFFPWSRIAVQILTMILHEISDLMALYQTGDEPFINSLWPSDAIRPQGTEWTNGLLPDGTKPLPEPMLIYHQ